MDRVIGGEYPVTTKWLNGNNRQTKTPELLFSSGRCALYAILYDILQDNPNCDRRLLIPDFLCDSVSRTILDAGWSYSFYHVDHDFRPEELLCTDAEAVLLINYFGMTDLETVISEARKKNEACTVIVDGVQAYYTAGYKRADYVFYSLRKWFPCPDGAYVLKNRCGELHEIPLGQNLFAEYKLAGNLLKGYPDDVSEKVFLPLLEKGEELLDETYLCGCSTYTKRIFGSLDLEAVARIRKENAGYLHRELQSLGIRHFYADRGVPFFVPIFMENRDQIRKTFFARQIFTPVHWPVLSKELNGDNDMYEQELSLICDQRYGLDDMKRQIEVLKSMK